MSWLLYGAYGYSGRLVLEAALERGMRPLVAGRDPHRTAALANRHGLPHRVFALDDPSAVARGIEGMEVVLNVAGPFSSTFDPVARACLAGGVHYLDITGEIPVLERAAALNPDARERGVLVVCGVGFDVVPTDCLAARVAGGIDAPRRVDLAFVAGSAPSRGTARTVLERIGEGAKVRRGGEIVDVEIGSVTRRIPFSDRERKCVAIPWGDVSTASRSTGATDVRVFTPVPPLVRAGARLVGPLLALGPVRSLARRAVDLWVHGPDERELAEGRARVWCEVTGDRGDVARGEIATPNPYALTAHAAAEAVRRVLEGATLEEAGSFTPSGLFGAGFAFGLDGVEPVGS